MPGEVENQRFGSTFHGPGIAFFPNLPQAASIQVRGQGLGSSCQIIEGGQEIPLHHRHRAGTTWLNAGTFHQRGHAKAALQQIPFATPQGMVSSEPATVVRGEDDIGTVRDAEFLNGIKQITKSLVGVFKHGGIVE